MKKITTPWSLAPMPSLETAWQDVDTSFERFCLTAEIGAIEQMLCEDAQQLAGAPHSRGGGRVGHRWGRTAARSASTAARLRCTVRGYAACAAVQVGSAGPRLAWPLGHEPDADQRVEAQAQAVCTFLRTICR